MHPNRCRRRHRATRGPRSVLSASLEIRLPRRTARRRAPGVGPQGSCSSSPWSSVCAFLLKSRSAGVITRAARDSYDQLQRVCQLADVARRVEVVGFIGLNRRAMPAPRRATHQIGASRRGRASGRGTAARRADAVWQPPTTRGMRGSPPVRGVSFHSGENRRKYLRLRLVRYAPSRSMT